MESQESQETNGLDCFRQLLQQAREALAKHDKATVWIIEAEPNDDGYVSIPPDLWKDMPGCLGGAGGTAFVGKVGAKSVLRQYMVVHRDHEAVKELKRLAATCGASLPIGTCDRLSVKPDRDAEGLFYAVLFAVAEPHLIEELTDPQLPKPWRLIRAPFLTVVRCLERLIEREADSQQAVRRDAGAEQRAEGMNRPPATPEAVAQSVKHFYGLLADNVAAVGDQLELAANPLLKPHLPTARIRAFAVRCALQSVPCDGLAGPHNPLAGILPGPVKPEVVLSWVHSLAGGMTSNIRAACTRLAQLMPAVEAWVTGESPASAELIAGWGGARERLFKGVEEAFEMLPSLVAQAGGLPCPKDVKRTPSPEDVPHDDFDMHAFLKALNEPPEDDEEPALIPTGEWGNGYVRRSDEDEDPWDQQCKEWRERDARFAAGKETPEDIKRQRQEANLKAYAEALIERRRKNRERAAARRREIENEERATYGLPPLEDVKAAEQDEESATPGTSGGDTPHEPQADGEGAGEFSGIVNRDCFDDLGRAVLGWRNGVLPMYWSGSYHPGHFAREAQSPLQRCLVQLDSLGLDALARRLQSAYDELRGHVDGLDSEYGKHPCPADASDSGRIQDGVLWPSYDKAAHFVDLVEEIRNAAEAARPQLRKNDGQKPRQPGEPAGATPRADTPITNAEANIRAREILATEPTITARGLAKRIPCALGLVPKLTSWKAVQEQRKKAQPPKTPKCISLEDVEESIGKDDAELKRLLVEQQDDGKSDGSIHPFKKRGKSRFIQRGTP